MQLGDIVRKLTVEYTTPGADEAIAKGRAYAQVHRDQGSAIADAERAVQRWVAAAERELVVLRQSEQAQRAYLAAQNAATVGLKFTGHTVGLLAEDFATVGRVAAQQVAPALGIVTPGVRAFAKEVGAAGAAVSKELTPALAAIGKEVAPLIPALGSLGKELAPVLAPAAIAVGAYFAVGAAIAYVARNARESVDAYKEFEDSQIKLQNMLNATTNASGRTANEINKLVDQLGDIEQAREAAQELLRFRSAVSGLNFDRTLSLAKDLAATGFGSLRQAASTLGNALKELSADSLKRLEDGGLRFNAVEKQMIEMFRDAGRAAEAQRTILDAVQRQVGGAGAAKDASLSGAYTALSDALKVSSEQLGEQIVRFTHLNSIVRTLAEGLRYLNERGKPPENMDAETAQALAAWQRQRQVFLRMRGLKEDSPAADLYAQKIPPPIALIGPDRQMLTAGRQAELVQLDDEKNKVQGVIGALEAEIEVKKKSDIEQKVHAKLREAQILGNAGYAAEAEKIRALVTQLDKLGEKQKDDRFDSAAKSLERHIARMDADTLAVGRSAGEHERLRAEFSLLESAKQADNSVTDEQIAAYTKYRATLDSAQALEAVGIKLGNERAETFQRIAQAAEKAATAQAKARIDQSTKFERDTLFLSPQDAAIASKLKDIYPDVTQAINSAEAAQMRLNAQLKEARDIGLEFAQSFVHGIMQGKSAMDALKGSLDNLASKLADKAIVDLLSGNLAQGAIEGVAAIGAAIAGSLTNSKFKKAQKEWEEMRGAAIDFMNTMTGQVQNELSQRLKSAFEDAKKLYEAAASAHDWLGAMQIYNSYISGINKMTKDFVNAQFNEAQGKGYLNQIKDAIDQANLLKAQAPDMADMVDTIFTANVQKIIDDAGLMGEQFDALHDIFGQLPASIHASTKALEDQNRALNDNARSIIDYVSGLTAGSNSTLSPRDRLAAAQSAFGAKLTLAKTGDASAQSTITQDAENLRLAAQAMYGSAAGYQAVLTQIKSSLLALPAVKETTDPVTQAIRDVLKAIEVGNAAQATDATMTGVVLAAVNAGNATNIARALSSYFDAIDANTDGSIDFDEMKKALGGMASDASLRDMFTRLDVDNSGSLSRLELLKAATDSGNVLDATNNTLTTTTNTLTASGNDVLSAIKSLNDTQVSTLALLNSQFSTSGISVHPTAYSDATVTLNNNMLTALNKIAFNTFAISKNTQLMASIASFQVGNLGLSGGTVVGTYATGGMIPPYGVGLVSEHSPGGGRFVQAGSKPITVSPFANDNSDLVSILRAILNENRALRAQVAAHMRVDEEGHALNEQAVDRQTNRLLNKESLQASRPATPGRKAA